MFFVQIGNEDYGIRYNITNASILNRTSNEDQKSLMLEILPSASGKLQVQLPRTIIDSKNGSDSDSDVPFLVTIYERSSVGTNTTESRIVTANETFTNKSYRSLDIDFSEHTYMITIAGTFLVPEFGPIAIAVAALSIGAILVTFRLRIRTERSNTLGERSSSIART